MKYANLNDLIRQGLTGWISPFFSSIFLKKTFSNKLEFFFFWGGRGWSLYCTLPLSPLYLNFLDPPLWKLCGVANYWLSCALLIDVFLVKIALLFSILWLEVETQQCTRRVTVVGCQSGHVKVAVIDLTGGPSMILFTLHREQHFYWILFQCLIHMGDKRLYSLFILWIKF